MFEVTHCPSADLHFHSLLPSSVCPFDGRPSPVKVPEPEAAEAGLARRSCERPQSGASPGRRTTVLPDLEPLHHVGRLCEQRGPRLVVRRRAAAVAAAIVSLAQ